MALVAGQYELEPQGDLLGKPKRRNSDGFGLSILKKVDSVYHDDHLTVVHDLGTFYF